MIYARVVQSADPLRFLLYDHILQGYRGMQCFLNAQYDDSNDFRVFFTRTHSIYLWSKIRHGYYATVYDVSYDEKSVYARSNVQ